MSSGFFDKFLSHVEKVEPEEIQNYLTRLSREKGFLLQVFEALQEGLVVIDQSGKILYINSSACALFSRKNEEATGALIYELLNQGAGAEKKQEWEKMQDAMATGKTISRDVPFHYPEEKLLNLYLSPVAPPSQQSSEQENEKSVEEPSGEPAYVLIIRDRTDSRKLTDEKIESERLNTLTMLAAGVAHELGNPLNSLTIHLQLLERKLNNIEGLNSKQQEEVKEILNITKGEMKRLNFILKQFLGALRPSNQRRILSNLNELLNECLLVLQAELDDRGIARRIELHENLPLLEVDPEQIKQVFFNLIRNAAQAMKEGGEFLIQSNIDNEGIALIFQDSGAGISKENMSKVFDPYFTTRNSGTGLGLLIVRKVIREHGGEIEIQSEEGKGTTVTLHLPRSYDPLRSLETKLEETEQPS